MNKLKALWKFSRPHAVIGTMVSVTTLYVMACENALFSDHIPLLLLAIITGVCCNIFIVGINQIEDIEIDKINKPYLPLVSGELSVKEAYRIIYSAMFIAIVCAAYVSIVILIVIILSLFIGMAYSLPPLYFKKHHLPAALAITTVRGVMVNLGGFYVFTSQIHGKGFITDDVYLLLTFIVTFSIAIAWFKDLPDMEGDAKYNIKTLAVLYSKKTALVLGTGLVILAYCISIYCHFINWGLVVSGPPPFKTVTLLYGHIILLILFLLNTFFSKFREQASLKKFYMRFWYFFFAEYILYLLAYL